MAMTTGKKIALVLFGYVLAVVAAFIVVTINDRMMNPFDLQASSGMTAFGDVVLFLFSLVLFSAPVTIAGLWFLKR
jgi:hypothetical protein